MDERMEFQELLLDLIASVRIAPPDGSRAMESPEKVVPPVESDDDIWLKVDQFGEQKGQLLPRAVSKYGGIDGVGIAEHLLELCRERFRVALESSPKGN